ncbi:pantoate/beta-alanine ligase [Desulfofarcimen acetoxidans DSM 771]|uniref:Pantothenate synthetase n=1 Tax=Desulfofarcimen acetoxidans (strain ATCC 49208 / DSM 771 / KCTC 5769 / VKM B-1644 / 5575) TaxID=485916 RepID=C8W3U0_DESAS|nr:pantoate--beta-alanine ligase [Desulfofarcimen acetoxidans]ACV61194.1 pantoate/beta-alanine ligase [Desulfofarcimen acetoxidans DSM 771]
MKTIKTIAEAKKFLKQARLQGLTIGLVPTMGYLHEGHLTLMRECKKKCDLTVVSIFVNPLQFGPKEDFSGYPRDLGRDSSLAEGVGVDLLFCPEPQEVYPANYSTYVDVEGLTGVLCGKSRPGHFRGVTTVVNKLFNIVRPDYAFFGQKDAQQVLVIKKMVRDLLMDLEIITVPIVRESDGLALSSRNVYLSREERRAALVLSLSLIMARDAVKSGENNVALLKDRVRQMISAEPLARIDYVEILSLPDLAEINSLEAPALLALAVFFGKTRLIDNVVLES